MSIVKIRKVHHPWKSSTFIVILLSQHIFGNPVPFGQPPILTSLSSSVYSNNISSKRDKTIERPNNLILEKNQIHLLLDQNKDKFSVRKKRGLYEAVKSIKQQKFFHFGIATKNVIKDIGKSIFRSAATFAAGIVLFNFLNTKVNNMLDNKNRNLDNLERQNREQQMPNAANDIAAAGSEIHTSTLKPNETIPDIKPDKVSLQLPDAVFGPAFNVANGLSQILGTIVHKTGSRMSNLFEALKPLIKRGAKDKFKSKKREVDVDENAITEKYDELEESTEHLETPIKNSFIALTSI